MERNRHLLQELLDQPVTVEGHTDLALLGRKCSGNAQRRKRHHLLFHGTLLHDFPLSLIPSFLRFPSAQPGYRHSRDHLAFVRNVPVTPQSLCASWIRGWGAEPAQSPFPMERTQAALSARYGNPEWYSRR